MAPSTSKKSQLAAVAAEVAPPAAAPEVAPAVVDVPPIDETSATPGDAGLTLGEKIAACVLTYSELIVDNKATCARLKEAQAVLKALQKDAAALQKQAVSKKKRQGAVAGGDGVARPLSGFDKPTSISAELAAFLGESSDVQLSRTNVTRRINEYIKKESLQNPDNKRIIVPDAKLSALLGVDKLEIVPEITYFNLQTYTSKHFIKSAAAAAVVSATA